MPATCQAVVHTDNQRQINRPITRFYLANKVNKQRQCKNKSQGRTGFCWVHRFQRANQAYVLFATKIQVFIYRKGSAPKKGLICCYETNMKRQN